MFRNESVKYFRVEMRNNKNKVLQEIAFNDESWVNNVLSAVLSYHGKKQYRRYV